MNLQVHVEHVRTVVPTTPPGGSRRLSVHLRIADGWKLYGAGCDDGLPLALRTEPPGGLTEVSVPAGELTGTVRLHATVDDTVTGLRLHYQLCGTSVCHPPAELDIRLSDEEAH